MLSVPPFLFCLLLVVFSPCLCAQDAVFQTSSSTLKAVSTDLTALGRKVKLTVISGTIPAGVFILDYGAPIVAGGEVVSTGFAGATLEETDLDRGVLNVRVPAGMGMDDFIVLEGVRLDATALDEDPVTGSLQVPVITDVSPRLVVDPDSYILSTYQNSTSPKGELTLTSSEDFGSPFTDGVGQLGQNVATRVQIQVGDLPDGSIFIFPDSIVSFDSAAILDVLPGSELLLPTEKENHTITLSLHK